MFAVKTGMENAMPEGERLKFANNLENGGLFNFLYFYIFIMYFLLFYFLDYC